jgi:hypothetical protein
MGTIKREKQVGRALQLGGLSPQMVRAQRSTVAGEKYFSPVSTLTRAGTFSMTTN